MAHGDDIGWRSGNDPHKNTRQFDRAEFERREAEQAEKDAKAAEGDGKKLCTASRLGAGYGPRLSVAFRASRRDSGRKTVMEKVGTAITCRKCNTRVYFNASKRRLECECDAVREAKKN